MTVHLDLHLLTAFPPHNVNRDEDGRPKTALLGATLRGRISSQAKKRALRFAPHFPAGRRSVRTREAGIEVYETLRQGEGRLSQADAIRAAIAVSIGLGAGDGATQIGKSRPDAATARKILDRARELAGDKAKTGDDEEEAPGAGPSQPERVEHAIRRQLRSGQALVVSTQELATLRRRTRELLDGADLESWLEAVQNGLLSRDQIDIDTALFGRMVAARPEFEVEAAASVGHAVTTHAFAIEGDYFSAGEELNRLGEKGAAITGYAFFGSGVYYQHALLDLRQLRGNLVAGRSDDEAAALVVEATGQLLKGLVFAQPKGKRHAFASDGAASWVLARLGDGPALTYAHAFLKPVEAGHDGDLMAASIVRLAQFDQVLAGAYGLDRRRLVFNAWPGARAADAPAEGEHWSWQSFETALLGAIR